jgi:hypothetical protein
MGYTTKYETKPNTGSLFKAKKKEEGGPDYTGNAVINGTAMWMSAWINESKSGLKYLGLKFEKKEDKPPSARPPKPSPATTGTTTEPKEEDDVPF